MLSDLVLKVIPTVYSELYTDTPNQNAATHLNRQPYFL